MATGALALVEKLIKFAVSFFVFVLILAIAIYLVLAY